MTLCFQRFNIPENLISDILTLGYQILSLKFYLNMYFKNLHEPWTVWLRWLSSHLLH